MGATPRDQFENDLALEHAALSVLRPGVALCLEIGDHGTRDLLEKIVVDEEHHIDWDRGPAPQDRGDRVSAVPRPADLRVTIG